jgi:hypothetical protein
MLNESAGDCWLAMADADLLSWKRDRLQTAAQKVNEEVVGLAEHRMSRRMERQQTEALVTKAAEAHEKERIRRDQQKTDEWFQNLRSSGSRRSE